MKSPARSLVALGVLLGSLLTGAPWQIAVGLTIVWTGVVALVSFKLVDWTIGLRVAEDEEREGLDVTSHGEAAYRM